MHRNTIIAICVGFCAVAVIAGLFVATLSSANRPIGVAQTTPRAESAAPAPTTGALAQAPTNAPPTAAATSAPSTVATPEPTKTAPATAVPTIAPTSVPTTTPALAGEFIEYTVQRGDELLQLAKKYNVTVKEIMANNQIPNPDSLVVGQVLRIPKK
jgi:LysM repeat protein